MDDMEPMLNLLRLLGASAQTHKVVLLERHGRELRLECPVAMEPGTNLRIWLEGELLPGEVTRSSSDSGDLALGLHRQEVLLNCWPRSKWSIPESENSVVGSLAALDSRLKFLEQQRRTSAE